MAYGVFSREQTFFRGNRHFIAGTDVFSREQTFFSREQTFFRGNRRFFAGTDVFSREQTCSNLEVTDSFRRLTIAALSTGDV